MKKLTADAVGISELLCSELWSNPPNWQPSNWREVAEWIRSNGVNALNRAAREEAYDEKRELAGAEGRNAE